MQGTGVRGRGAMVVGVLIGVLFVVVALFLLSGASAAVDTRKLNNPLAPGGQVTNLALTPDGSYAVYLAAHSREGMVDLWSVSTGGGEPTRLASGVDGSFGHVVDFAITPDSNQVAFLAEHAPGTLAHDIYRVPVGGGTLVEVSPNLPSPGYYITDFALAPDGQRVVYRLGVGVLEQQYELYSIPLSGGTAVKISGTLVADGDVDDHFLIGPDSSRVVYLADQMTDGVQELFSAPIDGSSTAVKLNDPLVSGGDVTADFSISADGSYVVYEADQDVDRLQELYSVPLAGGTVVKLNPPLADGPDGIDHLLTPDGSQALFEVKPEGEWSDHLFSAPLGGGAPVELAATDVEADYQISGDSTTVVYRADADTYGQMEVYRVPVTGGTPLKLNGPITAGGDVTGMAIAPDSGSVIYRCDQEVDELYELYHGPLSGGEAVKLNGSLTVGGDVAPSADSPAFAFTPDSSRVLYWADQEADEAVALYSVPAGGGAPVRLSGFLAARTAADDLVFPPAGSDVLYSADQVEIASHDLYLVPVAGGSFQRLTQSSAATGDIEMAAISQDGQYALYLADGDRTDVVELYSVPLAGGDPVRLNSDLTAGGDVGTDFLISADGSRVVYRADQETDERFELYSVPAGGGPAVRLNQTFTDTSADVGAFKTAPDGNNVVYAADLDGDGQNRLFAVALAGGQPLTLTAEFSVDTPWTFEITPDSSNVVYKAESAGQESLFRVPVDGSSGPLLLYAAAETHTLFYEPTPDGNGVIFVDAVTNGPHLLYHVPFAGGPATQLNAPVNDSNEIAQNFAISPDNRYVVFRGDETHDLVHELFSVSLEEPAAPVRLHPVYTTGQRIVSFIIAPDSATVAYTAHQGPSDYPNPYEQIELYSAPIAGGNQVKLNAPLAYVYDDVIPGSLAVTPDSRYVFYVINQYSYSGEDLYLFAATISGTTTYQLDYLAAAEEGYFPLPEPAQFRLRADGRSVVYEGVQEAGGPLGLYSVPIVGGNPERLDGPMADGGALETGHTFRLNPDSRTVTYVADQEVDEAFELFATTVLSAAPASGLQMAAVDGSVILNWADTGASAVEIWRGDAPYFGPGRDCPLGGCSLTLAETFTDTNALLDGDPNEIEGNRFYALRSLNSAGAPAEAVRAGVFRFGLVPGQN